MYEGISPKDKDQVSKIIEARTKTFTELSEKYKKLHDYIEPMVADEEMKDLMNRIRFEINMIPMHDAVLLTAMAAQQIALDMLKPTKLFCLACGKEMNDETH